MRSYTSTSPGPLLAAGVLAGPCFMLVATIQEVTRPGYQPLRCQVSHLALGAAGWIQAINFFVTGALILAFAAGVRQALRPHKLLPALVGLIGVGLVAAALFATEPAYGCPPDPLAVPPGVTINGPAHDAAAGVFFLGFVAAGLVSGRRAFEQRNIVFAIYALLSVVAMLGLLTVASLGYAQSLGLLGVSGLFEWLALLSVFAWLTTYAISLVRGKQWQAARGR